MTMQPPQSPRYSDEQLSAWVDGECAPADRAEIESWLRTHAEEAARVRAWAADRAALHAVFAEVVKEPVPAPLADTVARDTPARGWRLWRATAAGESPMWSPRSPGSSSIWPPLRVAAATAAVFVLGGLSGAWLAWQWKDRAVLARAAPTSTPATTPETVAPTGWLRRAAFAHSVYTPEPRHAVEVKAQEEHLARWLTRRIEAPVKLFNLHSLGFDLVGGRLLPDGAGKSAQLMYQDAGGARVTVYLRKPEPGTETAFRYEQQGPLGMFYWIEDKCGFALVGELPKERLLALAKSIYEQDATMPAPSLTPPANTASSPAPSAPAASLPAR